MVKILYNKQFLLIMLLAVSFGSFGAGGCGSGGSGTNKQVKINGLIEEVIGGGSVSGIQVTVFEGGNRKDRDTTDALGEFTLRFRLRSETAQVTIEFEGPGFTLSRVITVAIRSDVSLGVVIDVSPPSITFTNWTVNQERINVSRFDDYIFNETEATLRIDGNGRKCIIAKGESRVEITADSISLLDCSEGISAESFGLVILEAVFDIDLLASKDGINAKDNSVVRLAMEASAIDNNITVTSINENGIRASGSSGVTIDPQNDCTISGGKNAINESGTAVVDPDGCTLVDQ